MFQVLFELDIFFIGTESLLCRMGDDVRDDCRHRGAVAAGVSVVVRVVGHGV